MFLIENLSYSQQSFCRADLILTTLITKSLFSLKSGW